MTSAATACSSSISVAAWFIRAELAGANHVEWSFENGAYSLGLAQSGRLVLAQRDRLVLFDPESGTIVRQIAAIAAERVSLRPARQVAFSRPAVPLPASPFGASTIEASTPAT